MPKKSSEYRVTIKGEWTDKHTQLYQEMIARAYGLEIVKSDKTKVSEGA